MRQSSCPAHLAPHLSPCLSPCHGPTGVSPAKPLPGPERLPQLQSQWYPIPLRLCQMPSGHCSSWRICTEVTAESWNRRGASSPCPDFDNASMAKISPERQPLNSKGACGEKDCLVPPPLLRRLSPPEHSPASLLWIRGIGRGSLVRVRASVETGRASYQRSRTGHHVSLQCPPAGCDGPLRLNLPSSPEVGGCPVPAQVVS